MNGQYMYNHKNLNQLVRLFKAFSPTAEYQSDDVFEFCDNIKNIFANKKIKYVLENKSKRSFANSTYESIDKVIPYIKSYFNNLTNKDSCNFLEFLNYVFKIYTPNDSFYYVINYQNDILNNRSIITSCMQNLNFIYCDFYMNEQYLSKEFDANIIIKMLEFKLKVKKDIIEIEWYNDLIKKLKYNLFQANIENDKKRKEMYESILKIFMLKVEY